MLGRFFNETRSVVVPTQSLLFKVVRIPDLWRTDSGLFDSGHWQVGGGHFLPLWFGRPGPSYALSSEGYAFALDW